MMQKKNTYNSSDIQRQGVVRNLVYFKWQWTLKNTFIDTVWHLVYIWVYKSYHCTLRRHQLRTLDTQLFLSVCVTLTNFTMMHSGDKQKGTLNKTLLCDIG